MQEHPQKLPTEHCDYHTDLLKSSVKWVHWFSLPAAVFKSLFASKEEKMWEVVQARSQCSL